jgi:uncharacterized protein involved in exopolysaccharide biosynthesis
MRRLIRFAAALYPPSWRKRYGIEFDALLQETALDWRGFFDILQGAIAMQIRMFGITVASFAVIGALVAGLVAFRIPSEYASSAVLHLQAAESRTEVKKLLQDTLTQSALEDLITKEKLYDYQGDSDVRSIYNVVYRLRQAITVQRLHTAANSEATTLEITFADRDSVKAQRVAEKLISLIVEGSLAQQPHGFARIFVPAPPNFPRSPAWPNRWLITALGCTAGACSRAQSWRGVARRLRK